MSPKRKRKALAAHGLLHHLVSHILSMPEDRFRFIRNTHNGKPALDAIITQDMNVNLTRCLIGINMGDRPLAGTAPHTLLSAWHKGA